MHCDMTICKDCKDCQCTRPIGEYCLVRIQMERDLHDD